MGVKFTEYDVSRDENAAEEMVKKSGQMGVPVITIDGQVVIGFDRTRLRALLSGDKLHFGLKVADASRVATKSGGIPVFGAIIGEVTPGSLGDKAGLKPGDIITQVNGRQVSNSAEAEQVLGGIRSADIVSFLFLRGEETRKSEIVV
jgi:S1-C subfamily serine protease